MHVFAVAGEQDVPTSSALVSSLHEAQSELACSTREAVLAPISLTSVTDHAPTDANLVAPMAVRADKDFEV